MNASSDSGPQHLSYSLFQLSRIHDILCLSLLRRDYIRARRAWGILSRSGVIEWEAMWRLGLATLGDVDQMDYESNPGRERVEYLKICLLRCERMKKEEILTELILTLIKFGRYRDAYDELGFHLPSFPYHDNVALNTYAGMLALQLAFLTPPDGSTPTQPNISLLYESKAHFERVKLLKPDDPNAVAYISILKSANSDGKLDSYHIFKSLAGKEDDETVDKGDKGDTETELGDEEDNSEVEKQMHIE